MTSVAWGTQFEPDPMLNWMFMRPHMTTPKIQELVLQGRAEVDLEKRRQVRTRSCTGLAHDEAMWLFVHAQDELWAKRRDVPWQPYNITGSKALVYYFQVPNAR